MATAGNSHQYDSRFEQQQDEKDINNIPNPEIQSNKTKEHRQQQNAFRRLKAQEKRKNKFKSQREEENSLRRQKAQQKRQSRTESQRKTENAAQALKAKQKRQSKTAFQRQHENLLRRMKAQQKDQNKTESQRLQENAAKALIAKQKRQSWTEPQRKILNTERALKTQENRQILSQRANTNMDFETRKQQYDTKMNTWPSKACEFCDRMMYPIGLKTTILQAQNIETLTCFNINEYLEGSKVSLCHTCHDHLKKHKMSAQSKHNIMIVPPTPLCISSLTSMELRLISQVKLHLQIFKLCYYGQYRMKGTALHFPQTVNEISHQLPLTAVQSEVVVVAETLDAVKCRREFQIRPEFINQALLWLKQNNLLYKDVVIKDRSQEEMSLENIIVLTQPTLSIPATSNYIQKGNYEYLQGTIAKAQSNQQFFSIYGGRQCTANCAAFIAHSSAQNLVTFSKNNIDKILIDGDQYYGNILQHATDSLKEQIQKNAGYLHTDDIAGDFASPHFDTIASLTSASIWAKRYPPHWKN